MGNSDDIEYTVTKNGNLSVKIVDDLLAELRECEDYYSRESLIRSCAYDDYYNLTTADQFGANMSEAPCFLEESYISDNGDCEAIGDWFYYDCYMVLDFTAILATGESVIFTKVT